MLLKLLKKHGSVYRIEKATGITGDTIAKYFREVGIDYSTVKHITAYQKEQIFANYKKYRDQSRLLELSKQLGLKYATMKVFARKNGLTDISKRAEISKRRHKLRGHPMSGASHTDEAKMKIANSSRRLWARPKSPMRTRKSLQKRSDTQTRLMALAENKERYSRCKSGWYSKDGMYIFMRSSWELNYATYLDLLLSRGEIISWEYEVDVFRFTSIRKGIRSYRPDFKVVLQNKDIEYHEVKGWLDKPSITKFKLMKRFYPNVKIIVIGEKEYRLIMKSMDIK